MSQESPEIWWCRNLWKKNIKRGIYSTEIFTTERPLTRRRPPVITTLMSEGITSLFCWYTNRVRCVVSWIRSVTKLQFYLYARIRLGSWNLQNASWPLHELTKNAFLSRIISKLVSNLHLNPKTHILHDTVSIQVIITSDMGDDDDAFRIAFKSFQNVNRPWNSSAGPWMLTVCVNLYVATVVCRCGGGLVNIVLFGHSVPGCHYISINFKY